ncbi:hypothetical protein K435DRAFT_799936 [Dendrothele bispora CBS 962.96]|uniref:Uncharacterized protein n=1 Tax=Dendrothele bispora (strain CBS 962.96) TaxID=1314807 RepID=A0A4S8LUC7_DENBC|nr:hypothetical protein K435DRAFT_799936 [Dendrothele bispora CBS 962.96]
MMRIITWVDFLLLNGRKCRFFRFRDPQPDDPPTPAPSPEFTSMSTLPQPWSQGPPLSSQIQVDTCSNPNCISRVNQACPNARCKTHCGEIGGCHITNHRRAAEQLRSSSQSSSLANPPPVSITQMGPPAQHPSRIDNYTQILTQTSPSSAASITTQTSPPVSQPSAIPSKPVSSGHAAASFITPPAAQLLPDSAIPSKPISSGRQPQHYTELHAEAAESRRREESKRQAVRQEHDKARQFTKQVNSTVMVMAWIDSTEPIPFELQGEVVDGNFTIGQHILDRAGIVGSTFHYYRHGMRRWLSCTVPHIVKVNSPQQLFVDGVPALLLRLPSVKECDGLDSLLKPIVPVVPTSLLTQPRSLAARRKDLSQELGALRIDEGERVSSSKPKSRPLGSTSVHNHPFSKAAKGKRDASKSLSPRQPTKRSKATSSLSPSSAPTPRSPSSTSESQASPPPVPSTLPSTPSPTPPSPALRSTLTPPSSQPQHEVIEITSSPEAPPVPKTHMVTKLEAISPRIKQERAWSPDYCQTGTRTPTVIHIDDSSDDDEILRDWPENYHALDIANFFVDASSNSKGKGKLTVKALFLRAFPDAKITDQRGWPKSTYYYHKQWWEGAPQSTRQRFIDVGRTDDGLWSEFMAEVSAPKAHVKAVRQKILRQKKRKEREQSFIDDEEENEAPQPYARRSKFICVPSEGEEEEEDQLVDDEL